MGELESPKPSDTEQSLGDQSTFGDAGSSASDVSGLDDALYDLHTDPWELINLFDHPPHRPRQEQLERLTSNWLDQVRV